MRIRLFQKIIKIIIVVVSLIIFAFLVDKIWPCFYKIKDTNLATIFTGSVTLIAGLGAVLVSQANIKNRELAEAHREKKIELYNRFNNKIYEMFAGINPNTTGKSPSEQELVDFMIKFKRDLMFRASPKVIKAVIKFEQASSVQKTKDSVLRHIDNIYSAMRKDIGLTNFGLGGMELIQIFLKDKSEIWKIK